MDSNADVLFQIFIQRSDRDPKLLRGVDGLRSRSAPNLNDIARTEKAHLPRSGTLDRLKILHEDS